MRTIVPVVAALAACEEIVISAVFRRVVQVRDGESYRSFGQRVRLPMHRGAAGELAAAAGPLEADPVADDCPVARVPGFVLSLDGRAAAFRRAGFRLKSSGSAPISMFAATQPSFHGFVRALSNDTPFSRAIEKPAPAPAPPSRSPRSHTSIPSRNSIPTGEQKVLHALARLEAVGVTSPSKLQLSASAGYSNPKSGGFAGPTVARLRKNLIRSAGGRAELTDAGRKAALMPERPVSTKELQERLFAMLGEGERKLLSLLIAAHPGTMALGTVLPSRL